MRIDARDDHSSHLSAPEQPPQNPRLEKAGEFDAGNLPSILIKVRGLGEGEHKIDFLADAAALELEPFVSTVRIFGTLTKSGEQIHLKAGASAIGSFECTRCADNFDRAIEVLLRLEFVSPRLERDPADPNVHVYDSGLSAYIDITDDVRDSLALAIPMKHLCRPNCKGLCPECGKNLNSGLCDHVQDRASETKFSALKSLGERLRAEEGTAGPQTKPFIGLN